MARLNEVRFGQIVDSLSAVGSRRATEPFSCPLRITRIRIVSPMDDASAIRTSTRYR